MLLVAYKHRELVPSEERAIKLGHALFSCRLASELNETFARKGVLVVYVILYRRNMTRIRLHMRTEIIYGNRVPNSIDKEDCFDCRNERCPNPTVEGYIEALRGKPEVLLCSVAWSTERHVDGTVYLISNTLSCLPLALCSRNLQEPQEFIHFGRIWEEVYLEVTGYGECGARLVSRC